MDADSETNTTAESTSTSTTWLLIYTAIALFVIHQVYGLTYFWRKGIPGPRPYPFIGNTIELLSGSVPAFRKWKEKYGDIYGIQFGGNSSLVITDVDLARHVLIKDFASNFYSKHDTDFKMKYLSDSLVVQEGADWKRSRGYTSPAFSGSKMKQMIPGINGSCDALLDVIEQNNRKSVDMHGLFGAYSLDCVACCAFGVEGNCQKDPDGPFVKYAKQTTSQSSSNAAVYLMFLCPFLAPVFNYFDVQLDVIPKEAIEFFANIVKQSVELRKQGDGNKKKDFLQLMMDAAEGEEDHDNSSKDEKAGLEEVMKKRPLTAKELTGQCLIFFLAGYDTVASSMAYVAYALAVYPEVQKKLLEEIDEMVPQGEPVSYEMAFKLEYLDMVWSECLRMWPFQFALQRTCTKDFHYKDIVIHRDQQVYIDTFGIQRDARHWSEPDNFDPERFRKEAKQSRHPCTYMPFGAGPRNCVGMRFAVLEIKIGLIRILQKYMFEKAPETVDLSDLSNFGKQVLFPTKGIHVRLVPRSEGKEGTS